MEAAFRWIRWNREHATQHGVSVEEAESVVRGAGRGWPRAIGDDKWMVQGRGQGGRMVQVVYLIDAPPAKTLFVLHAMPLTTRRRRRGK